GIVVHVVPVADLARSAVAAAIVGDDAITFADEVEHLGVPIIGTQRPAVMEHDWLCVPRAPILEINLSPVFGGDRAHRTSPFRINVWTGSCGPWIQGVRDRMTVVRQARFGQAQQAVSAPRDPVPSERRRLRPPHGRRMGTTGEWPPATRGSPPAPAKAGPGRGPLPRGRVRSR